MALDVGVVVSGDRGAVDRARRIAHVLRERGDEVEILEGPVAAARGFGRRIRPPLRPYDVLHVIPDRWLFGLSVLVGRFAARSVFVDVSRLDIEAPPASDEGGALSLEGLKGVTEGFMARLLGEVVVEAVVARDPAQYESLVRARVPARVVSIFMDGPTPSDFPRRSPPLSSDRCEVVLIAAPEETARKEAAIRAIEAKPAFRLAVVSRDPEDPPGRLVESLRTADLALILDSRDQASAPRGLVEAMMVGVPVIADPTRAVRSIFGDALAYLPAASAPAVADFVLELAMDRSKREGLVAAADRWLSEFGFEASNQALTTLYDTYVRRPTPKEKSRPSSPSAGEATDRAT